MHYNKDKVFLFLNIILIIVSFLIFAKFTNIVRAQSLDLWGDGTQQALATTGLGTQNPSVIIVNIIRIFLGFLGIIAVVIIMYAGFLWMTAGGNADQIGKAKKWMINGVIGLVIILSSFAIASFILARLIAATGAGGGGENPPITPFPPGPSPFLNCIDPATKPEQVCGIGNAECVAALSATPYVCAISPENGPKGAYVTIEGYHFNLYDKDKSKVEFYDKINNTVTPAEIVTCLGNSLTNWTDNRIIIKVPDIEIGDYTIRVIDKEDVVNEVDNRKAFKVIVGAVPPGIACILPGSGKENAGVIVYGDYFGDTKEIDSTVVFSQEVIANIADNADWSMKEIKTAVPSGAMRGDVFVKVGELKSNGYLFTVVCENNSECASGCCYNSSYCANATYCKAGVGELCSNSSGCNKGDACQTGLICDGQNCKCRELHPGDVCLFAEGAVCSSSGECGGSLVCNRTNCKCENLPGPGAKCYGGCGGSCTLGSICNSDCVCEESPTIYWISPDNGANGNLVTIGGAHFGAKQGNGKVEFILGDSIIKANLAGAVNALCSSADWTDSQIIVEVPKSDTPLSPLKEGNYSVKVITSAQKESNKKQFTVNNIARPGLCAAYKVAGEEKINEGEFEQKINLAGVNLQDINDKTEVYFGEGRNDGMWPIETSGIIISNAGIPSIKVSGDKLGVGIFVQDNATNSQRSNPVNFFVLKYSSLPVIDGFSPLAGHTGDYVTIYGRDFGDIAGKVKFGDAEGDFSFPDICLDSLWTNNQIIVKVPGLNTPLTPLQEGKYKVKVITNSAYGGNEVSYDKGDFYVGDYCSSDYKACGKEVGEGADGGDGCQKEGRGICVKSVRPGLCKISPSNGHENTEVSFLGENFGAAEIGGVKGKAEFNAMNDEKIVGKVAVEVFGWTNGTSGNADSTKAKAPANVRNGLINIISATGIESNGINFEYKQCVDNNECAASTSCCPTNSYFKGSCMANATACGLGAKPPTDYMWSFTTETPAVKNCAVITNAQECESNGYCCFNGSVCASNGCPESLVPKVMEHCDKGQSCNNNSAGPSPSPWKEWPNGQSACVDSIIRADFSVGINQSTLTSGNIIIKECVSENLCDVVVAGTVVPSVMGFSFTAESNLKKDTWYQVVLTGDNGIKAVDKDGKIGKFLDGDGDGAPGGDYVWKFKTRNDDKPCEAGCAFVNPAEYIAPNKNLIKYNGNIRAKDNVCELLRNKGETWSWSSDTPAKATISSEKTCCSGSSCGNDKTCVLPIAETLGVPVKISGTAGIAGKYLSDTADLYIDFTDFKVEEFWPRCNDSCLNADVGARFSGEISATTVVGNILIEGEEGVKGKEGAIREGSGNKRIGFKNLSLKVNTNYRVIIKGGENGLRNVSGGDLDNLNYDSNGDKVNDSFSWEFKTGKEQCVIHSVSVEPAYGVVAKIGDGLMYNAVPLSTPDKCGGQKLNAFSYDWNFSAPAGSFASISNYPTCGNGIVEKGEDCDPSVRGLDADSDADWARMGCSLTCLNLGNNIKCGTSAVGCCGNGKVETGEECDGEVWCTDKCLKKGSNVSYNFFCGNGKIETGEDCDGEAGCDRVSCLWRGTVKCNATLTSGCCGNGGNPEAGEECDEGVVGNKDNGVGCSSKCLMEGTAKCTGNCCGNGKIDAGEDCDDGKAVASDGCSASCLNEGTTSACGNRIVETGEDCDEGIYNGTVKDNNNTVVGCSITCLNLGTATGAAATSTPYQLVTAASGPTVLGQTSATTDITAMEAKSSKNGTGKFTIQCGYTNESQCPSGMGIGSNSCCYARPVVVSPANNITNFCPNGTLEIAFNQFMDKDILEKANILEKKNDGSGCGAVLGEMAERGKEEIEGEEGKEGEEGEEIRRWKLEIVNLVNEINNFFFNLFLGNKFISALSGLKINYTNVKTYFAGLVNFAKADATWCKVSQKITARNDNEKTSAIITPSELLDSNSQYRLNFDGLKNMYGVPIANTDSKITVSARKEICLIDHIDVLIDNTSPTVATPDDIFICAGRNDCGSATTELSKDDDADSSTAGNQHLYRAYTLDKEENLLTADYFWEEYDPNTAISIQTPLSGQQRFVTANPLEEADATVSVGGASAYGSATTTVKVIIFMCENPWPAIEDFPYTDTDYNFSSFYCKDKKPENLPGLGNVLPICKGSNCNTGILKEYLWVEE